MPSDFDRLMRRADDSLFRVFGEDREVCKPTYMAPGGMPVPCEVILARNVTVAGADGMFRPVRVLAELRCHQVQCRRGGILTVPEGRFKLAEPIDNDGLVERWELLEVT